MACSKALRNERGYVLVSGTALILLIFTLLFSSSWIFWFLIEKQKTQKLCYNHMLEAQKILIKTQERILSLNTKAWALIYEKRFLDVVILTAPPQIKIAARLRRRLVIYLQKKLRTKQKSILHYGNLRARERVLRLRRKMRSHLKGSARDWRKSPPTVYLRSVWVRAQVQPQFREIAPPYKRVNNYKAKQTLGLQWSMPIEKLIPRSWRRFVTVRDQWHGSCFTHPHRKGGKWFANIGRGKF